MNAKSKDPEFVIVGRITKPHGVKGALKVDPITDDPQRFKTLKSVRVGPEDDPGDSIDIARIQFQNKFVILSFEGIETREDADAFRGQYLYISQDELMPLPDDSVYIFELIGLEVYTNKNEFVGIVKDVREFPANDMFVVEKDDHEYLIPDVPDIVKDVDPDSGKIIINPVEGLLE